jgi:hypothetical protein
MSKLLSKEINDADFVNLANDCVGVGLIPTGNKNYKLAERYAKQEAIGFRTWMDNRGYFAQWKDGVAGYIRQENQILFSHWQPLEKIYELYIKSKQ